MLSVTAISAVGAATSSMELHRMSLRPSASESMPMKGDMAAIPRTAIPTVRPVLIGEAWKSCMTSGSTACIG